MTVSPIKAKRVSELQELLQNHSSLIMASCTGLGVPEQNKLRIEVRKKGGTLKVIKNSLFYVALKKSAAYGESPDLIEEIAKDLKGPVTLAFAGDDFPGISKILLNHAKENSGLSLKSACLDRSYLKLGEIKELASLPSRQEMLRIIGQGLQAPALKLARGMQEVIASLARAIKALGEKNA